MELSGVVPRRIPCIPGGRAGPRFGPRCRNFAPVSMRPGFRDDGHLKYYCEGERCGGGGKAEKQVEKNTKKKKLKLVKGLYKELSMFSRMGFGIELIDGGSGLVGELQGKRISEAAEVLLTQLEQLKAEEKEMKKRRKQEKAKLKAERMKRAMESDSSSSSSSSSESSDSETDEVVDMNRLRSESPAQMPGLEQPLPVAEELAALSLASTSQLSTAEIPGSPSNVSSEPAKKIEVCMGGKCRKSGGAALLNELQRVVGIEGAIVGCKCMGKCRDGPNVRVSNGARTRIDGIGDSSIRVSLAPMNPLYIGVGLDDVGVIVSNFLGSQQSDVDIGLSPAA